MALNKANCTITTQRRTGSPRALVDWLGATRARYQVNAPEVLTPDNVLIGVSLFVDPGVDVQEGDLIRITALRQFVSVQGRSRWTAHQVRPSPGNTPALRVDLVGAEVQ